jgi:pimeloyl-ACP methyl ester carboxylesterase
MACTRSEGYIDGRQSKAHWTSSDATGGYMFRFIAAAALLAAPALARIEPFPANFRTQMVQTNGPHLFVRVGGQRPAVVLLHGFGDTGDMWAPLAVVLAKDHTVIVPHLRGMGLSAHPDSGYTKKNQAVDIAGVMDALDVQKADLVTHDIGNMVGYALAAQYPGRIARWALVRGRERIYLDRFWNELSANPRKIDEETRRHYARLYAQPHAIHGAFEQFGAFAQDAIDNKALPAGTVTSGIVPNSGHWIMEENPQATVKLVTEFLAK